MKCPLIENHPQGAPELRGPVGAHKIMLTVDDGDDDTGGALEFRFLVCADCGAKLAGSYSKWVHDQRGARRLER